MMKSKIYYYYSVLPVLILMITMAVMTPALGQTGKGIPKDSAVFTFKSSEQTWVVPQGVTNVKIVATGAQGGGPNSGKGGLVITDVKVTPGAKLSISTGGQAASPDGGFNGGGKGCGKGFGGGGATDVKIDGTKVLIAGGGGGSGYGGKGGDGGGLTGAIGIYDGDKEGYHIAGGGTQETGGKGARAYFSKSGTEGNGGEGINNRGDCTNNAMGGGGGGYYGGGGSGAGGGGGGSSYTDSNICNNVKHEQGVNDGNGKVVIYW